MRRETLVLRGEWKKAGVEGPAWNAVELAALAVRIGGGRDPFEIARRRGIEIVQQPREDNGGRTLLVVHPTLFAIAIDGSRGERGLRTYRGVATAELLRTGRPFTTGDVLLLVAGLVAWDAKSTPWIPAWFRRSLGERRYRVSHG